MVTLLSSHVSKANIGCFDSEAVRFVDIFEVLSDAQNLYPDFSDWYWGKVVPGLVAGTREIILELNDYEIKGVAVIKSTSHERKLCNLTVANGYKGRGIGLRLFERAFESLGTDKPFLTVSEERYPEFKRVFEYYGFSTTAVVPDVYRQGKLEYILNGSQSSLS